MRIRTQQLEQKTAAAVVVVVVVVTDYNTGVAVVLRWLTDEHAAWFGDGAPCVQSLKQDRNCRKCVPTPRPADPPDAAAAAAAASDAAAESPAPSAV